jgi:hypothetical protein
MANDSKIIVGANGSTSGYVGSDPNSKGAFANEAALVLEYPVGEFGWFAVVGDTDTVWVWDVEGVEWIDTGVPSSGGGDMLSSTYDPNGVEGDAFDSSNHSYDNTTSGLESDSVQDAIDEIVDNLPAPFVLTNGEGTTANGSAVDLGGALTADVDIAMSNETKFGINGLNTTSGIRGGHIDVSCDSVAGDNWVRISSKDSLGRVIGIDITEVIATVYGPAAFFKGLGYGNDYSANFDWLSIPHLGHIESLIANLNEEIVLACSDELTAITAGTSKITFRMPFAMTLTEVRANVNTAPTGSTLIVDINESGTTILSTKLSIDATELTSVTAATAAVISDTSLADDAEITIDIDQVGSTIAGKGLKVTLIGKKT